MSGSTLHFDRQILAKQIMSSLREFYILIVMPVGNPVIGALLNLELIQPGLILPTQLNLVLYLTGVGKQTSLKQRLHSRYWGRSTVLQF